LLSGYTSLIREARSNEDAGMDKSEAVRQTVRSCVKRGELMDFLKKYGSEVANMLITEWNWSEALHISWEEGRMETLIWFPTLSTV
jgi:hypothetical protein